MRSNQDGSRRQRQRGRGREGGEVGHRRGGIAGVSAVASAPRVVDSENSGGIAGSASNGSGWKAGRRRVGAGSVGGGTASDGELLEKQQG